MPLHVENMCVIFSVITVVLNAGNEWVLTGNKSDLPEISNDNYIFNEVLGIYF